MKKNSSILAFITTLALAVMSCGLQVVPFNGPQQGPIPQGPQPGPIPQGPQPGPGGPQQPGPGGPQQPIPGGPQQLCPPSQPGQPPQPCGPQPPEPGGPQQPTPGGPQQPPNPQPPAPVQPTETKVKKSGGGGKQSPTITPTTPAGASKVKVIPITIDFQASDLSVDAGHYLHVYIVNNGGSSGNITFAITCTGLFTVTNGGSSSSIAYSTAKVTYDFTKVGARWINSKIKLDKGTGYYNLTCTISPDTIETNTSNNSVTKTLTISP